MSRPIPMGPCIALLKAFDPNNPAPQQAIAAASAACEMALGETVAAALNTGQFAALVDLWLVDADSDDFDMIKAWLADGNFVKPPKALATFGPRGLAERDVWNVGAAA